MSVNSVTYTSPTSITLDLNTIGAAAGPVTVTVTNPDGQAFTSLSGFLTHHGRLRPAPIVDGISPTSGLASGGTAATAERDRLRRRRDRHDRRRGRDREST